MNPAIQNLAISLGAMQGRRSLFIHVGHTSTNMSFIFLVLVARKIPFDDPVILNYVRAGYIASQIICIAVYLYISMKVRGGPTPL